MGGGEEWRILLLNGAGLEDGGISRMHFPEITQHMQKQKFGWSLRGGYLSVHYMHMAYINYLRVKVGSASV